jgi:3-oxoacyl-[acyl-carrier-protein] synthase II
MAFEDAGITDEENFAANAEVFMGTTMGEGREMGEIIRKRLSESSVSRQELSKFPAHNISLAVCREFGIHRTPMLISNACAAGNFAITAAYERIRKGKTTFAVAGGAELFSEVAFKGFSKLRSVASEKCSPFDKNREGMILGEGAGALLLESYESAKKRNADIYAEVIGWGASCDAYHMAVPSPEANGIITAVKNALENAGIEADDVDYICAHGTGTAANDKAESRAINEIFARKFPVSSLKSMIGHAMGAASAIEAAACCMTIKTGIVLPTINFREADEECDIDCVPNEARKVNVRIAANNAYAFGGNNSCVLFSEVCDE